MQQMQVFITANLLYMFQGVYRPHHQEYIKL